MNEVETETQLTKLDQGVDFLASSFAGGASGFPLCFENYTQSEKEKTIEITGGFSEIKNNKLIVLID